MVQVDWDLANKSPMTGAEKSCCFWGNCMLFKRNRRGRDRERQRRVMRERRRNKDSEWKYNRGRKRKWQNAEHAAYGHTEPTCMLPTVLYMEPRGKITPYVKHITRPWQWYHQYESCSLTVLSQSLQMVAGHTWAWLLVDTVKHSSYRGRQLTKTGGNKDIHMHTGIHQPLCCCSPHSESSRNASLETCPTQTAVSCPAERKMTSAVHFL